MAVEKIAPVTASLSGRQNFSDFGHNTRPRAFVLVRFFSPKKTPYIKLTSVASQVRKAKWSSFFSSLFSHLSVLFGQKCDRYFCSGAGVCVQRPTRKIYATQIPRECRLLPITIRIIVACDISSLTSNVGRRKNRNIGGTACTIKRAGVVNDSAPGSCADCVFGAFFGGSTSHHGEFFMAVFFQHAVSLLVCRCVNVRVCGGQAPSTRFLRAKFLDRVSVGGQVHIGAVYNEMSACMWEVNRAVEQSVCTLTLINRGLS